MPKELKKLPTELKYTPENEVILYACEPGDAISVSSCPDWLRASIDRGQIRLVTGDSIDGSDWLYLQVFTGEDWEICKTDMAVGMSKGGELYVREVLV